MLHVDSSWISAGRQYRLGKIHRSVPLQAVPFKADYCSFLLEITPSFLLGTESSYGVFAALSYIKNDF
jgi:hypothetical protein